MSVLAVAVHPDDETLGCGAALLRHAARGEEIHWLVVTSGHMPDFPVGYEARQEAVMKRVAENYPFASVTWLRLPSTRLDRVPRNRIVRGIHDTVDRVRPATVYVPGPSDVHSDHRIVWQATEGVLKAFRMTDLGVRRVLICETPSETGAGSPALGVGFRPNVFIDVSPFLPRKLELLALYEKEVQAGHLPRSFDGVRALARWRGVSVGVEYAEAFELLREVGLLAGDLETGWHDKK